MAKHHFEVQAVAREDVGKGASRRLRREQGQIPAVVYGADKPAQSITLEHNEILHALEHEAFYSSIIELKIGKESEDVMLKDVQRHPFKPKILHVDFKRIQRGVAMKVRVPLHFVGTDEAPGVKEGGVLSHMMNDVEISCLPRNLPEYLEVNVSAMEMDQVLHLSDVVVTEGVAILALEGDEPQDEPVASVHMPKVVEEEPAESEGEEGATDAAGDSAEAGAAEGGDAPSEGGDDAQAADKPEGE